MPQRRLLNPAFQLLRASIYLNGTSSLSKQPVLLRSPEHEYSLFLALVRNMIVSISRETKLSVRVLRVGSSESSHPFGQSHGLD